MESPGMAGAVDFELEIGAANRAGYPVTARVKGGGEASSTMRWSVTGRELDARLAAIRDSVLASSATTRRLATYGEQPVRALGQSLFESAVSGEIRLLYAAAYQQSRLEGKQLRLVLRVRPAELARLPWEFLFDPNDDNYIGLRMPMVRFPQVLEPQRPLKVSPPLSILGMVARPADQAALDVRTEKRRLETALADLEKGGHVNLNWVLGQSWRDLQRTVDSGTWHVLHFIGHGGFDSQSGEGVLALAEEEGGTFHLGAGDLSMLLCDHFPLRLVVLNACDTGRASSLNAFSSTAGALVRRGIPAILAMQFEITDRAAIEFTRTFYDELAHRRPVDACVMRARRAIHIAQPNSLEWGTPVLYLRSTDGQIFDFTESDSAEGRLGSSKETGQRPPREPIEEPAQAAWSLRSTAAASGKREARSQASRTPRREKATNASSVDESLVVRRAYSALVMAFLSLLLFFLAIFGPGAMVVGFLALRKINTSKRTAAARRPAIAGIVIGFLGTCGSLVFYYWVIFLAPR